MLNLTVELRHMVKGWLAVCVGMVMCRQPDVAQRVFFFSFFLFVFLWHVIISTHISSSIYLWVWKGGRRSLKEVSWARSFIQVRSEQWLVERLDRFFTATLIYCLVLTWVVNVGLAAPRRAPPLGVRHPRSLASPHTVKAYLAGVGVELVHLQSLNLGFYVCPFLYIKTLPEHYYYYLGPRDSILFYFFLPLTPMTPEGQLCSGV